MIGLKCTWSHAEITEIVSETIGRNDYSEFNVRLVITGGESEDSITPGSKPRLLVMITPVKTFPHEWYESGVNIITSDNTRTIPGAKSTDYIHAIMALNRAGAEGAVESVYVDGDGNVLEGTTSNLFCVINGQLTTPALEILPGITRDVVLDLARAPFKPQLRPISKSEFVTADEVFLTSSNKEILPVASVNGNPIGTGTPGQVTKRIMELFRRYTDQYAEGYGS